MKTLMRFNGFSSLLVTRNARPQVVLGWMWDPKVKGPFRAPQLHSEQLALQACPVVSVDLGNTYLIHNSVL